MNSFAKSLFFSKLQKFAQKLMSSQHFYRKCLLFQKIWENSLVAKTEKNYFLQKAEIFSKLYWDNFSLS